MAIHAENPLRCAGISQVFYFPLAVPTFEAGGAKGLVSCQDGQVFNLVSTVAAAVSAVVAN